MARLRDLKLRRENGAFDWLVVSLLMAFLLFTFGGGTIAIMFNSHGYWEGDDHIPDVFVMFAKVINFSTIGVLAIFLAMVIAVAAIVLFSVRSKHEEAMASDGEIKANQSAIIVQNNRVLANQGQLTALCQQVVAMQNAILGGQPPSFVPWPGGQGAPHPARGWDTAQQRIVVQRHKDELDEATKKARQEGWEEGWVDCAERQTLEEQGKVVRLRQSHPPEK